MNEAPESPGLPASTWSVDLPTEEATRALAVALAPLLLPSDLVVLTGDLGAGKTFFSGCLLHALGLAEDEPVTSPTYALVSEYLVPSARGALDLVVLHADLYRLRGPDEVLELGLLERRDRGAILVVEWGAPYAVELGGDAIELVIAQDPRLASIVVDSPRTRAVTRALARARFPDVMLRSGR